MRAVARLISAMEPRLTFDVNPFACDDESQQLVIESRIFNQSVDFHVTLLSVAPHQKLTLRSESAERR